MKHSHLVMILSLLLLAGCVGLFSTEQPQPPQATEPPAATVAPAPEITPTPPGSPTPPGPVTLNIWLPPQFDPQADTPAAQILRARLNEFSSRRPELRVEVRIKAVEGPGGILDSLTTAGAAAPLALPDLVAMPRPLLETASLKGLLHPFDTISAAMDDPDWYDYARQLGQLQNSVFGLPFAGDALVMVYRPVAIETAPLDWQALLDAGSPFVFPAADLQAVFTMAQYQSLGGAIQDDQGRPMLEVEPLTELLAYYQSAEQAGVMPFWLTQYQSDEQVWDAFLENQSNMVVTWSSRYLQNLLADTAASHIPTRDAAAYTVTSGWVWTLASPEPERHAAAAQLAEFLTESSFLARWTEAAGYLPTRPSALNGWTNASLQTLVGEIVDSAELYPSTDLLISLGPPLQQAVVQALKQQIEAPVAAQDAVNSLEAP